MENFQKYCTLIENKWLEDSEIKVFGKELLRLDPELNESELEELVVTWVNQKESKIIKELRTLERNFWKDLWEEFKLQDELEKQEELLLLLMREGLFTSDETEFYYDSGLEKIYYRISKELSGN